MDRVAVVELLAPSEVPDLDAVGQRLLEAAAEVFAERGYDGAGVAEIARRAGVTTGAIYGRFTGKADLLASVVGLYTADELDALFADHRFQGRTEDIIRIAGSHLVDRDDNNTPALLFEAFAAARRHPEVAELLRTRMEERRARLAEIIDTAKADGGIDSLIDTESLVAFCHAVGFGFLFFDALDLAVPEPGPWEALISRLMAAVGDPSLDPQLSPTPTEAPATGSPKEP